MSRAIKIFFLMYICSAFSAPVRKNVSKQPDSDLFKGVFRMYQSNNIKINSNDLHYKSYLNEIIKELEKDQVFTKKIQEAEDHNRTEHIAQSLQFVSHHIRNKLDEIKRKEIERLNILENELERRNLESKGLKVPPPNANFENIINVDKNHLDHANAHTFEISDLQKLIKKTEEDLKYIDEAQEKQYVDHEMKKEHLKKKKLESIKDAEERKKMEAEFVASQSRHNNHSKVHHPGNQEQLKEVWEKSDHLDPNEFNPRTFFDLHDVNADGHLDINEVESLMQNEISKVYEENNTDDDMQEKYHEMMRMRKEMMSGMDRNKDNMISRDEFLSYTKTNEFKDDSEWKTQEEDGKKPYTDSEFKEYEYEYNQNEDEEEDEFSDQDETLRHIPKLKDLHDSGDKENNPSHAPPPVQVNANNQNGAKSNL